VSRSKSHRACSLRRRRRSAPLVALLATLAPPALGDTLSLAGDPAPAGDTSFFVPGADARGHATLRARLLAEYAHAPLVVLTARQDEVAVVERQLALGANVSLALFQRLLLDVELPLTAWNEGEPSELDAPSSPVLGDVRLGGRARLLGDADSTSKLGAGVRLWLPTGASPYASGGFGAEPFVSAAHVQQRLDLTGVFGFRYRERAMVPSLLPLRTGPAVTFGAAAHVALDRSGAVRLGPELSCDLAVGGDTKLFDPRSSVARALLALVYRPAAFPLTFALGAGPGLGDGPGAADYHVVLRLSFSPEAPPPPPDADGDAIADDDDACPSIRGISSGDPLMHGCPELPTDTDGDAIPDMFDACPRHAGLPSTDRRQHGCPPIQDRDRDGVADEHDACPDAKGVPHSEPEKNGCPPPPPAARLEAARIVISEQVLFETGTASIRPESDAILGEVLRVLTEHPELTLVEVQGHTDSTGAAELNRKLSRDRAEAVVAWLVTRGIAKERLRAEGHGADKPIADNETEAGREKNRRVEFRVIERKGTP
jgi:outer membrane protein OmpA-like peptidoglycan-associated protein